MPKRFKVQKEEAWTMCENPHPMGRGGGYCWGGEDHPYNFWIIIDTTQVINKGFAMSDWNEYQDAKAECDILNTNPIAEVVADIEGLKFTVRYVKYCEDSRTPGLLGQIKGVTDWEHREVKIGIKDNPKLLETLKHELHHIQDPEWDCGNRDVFGRGGLN